MVVGFGDFLIHFSPFGYERMFQTDLMHMTFTGAEANVCSALGYWKEKVKFVTKLPQNTLSEKGVAFLKGLGVNTDDVQYGEGRMGIYFLEKGYSIRPSSVIYDRFNSVFTNSEFEDYNWDSIFCDAKAFYLSGITPSLSESLFNCCKVALIEARKRDIPVFFDVNLRSAICSIEKSRDIFRELCPYITHLIANEEHLKQLLEINVHSSEDKNRLYDFTKMVQSATNIKNVAVTVRRTISVNKALIYASFSDGTDVAISNEKNIDVVDRVGSGDAFSAGIVYAFLNRFDVKETAEFAISSSALKHTINDDINFSSVDEIKSVMKDNGRDVKR